MFRRRHRGLRVEHLRDPVTAHRRPRHHHQHEGRHHHRHQDLHQVGEERGQRPDLHLPVVDAVTSEPDHRDAGDVHDEHHEREHGGHPPPRAQGHVGQVVVGLPEPLSLVGLADERADDPDPGDLLPQDPVDLVDARLHLAEVGHHPADDEADADEQRRDDDGEDPAQAEVLAQRHDDAADHHDRRGHDHGAGHQHQHLHLGHVVGAARDQRRCAELLHLAGGEGADALEEVPAQVAAEAHRGACGEPDRS